MNRRPHTPSRHWLSDMSADEARVEIVRALEAESGCCDRAARRLDLSRMNLWRHLRDHGMLSMPAEIEARARRRFQLTG